jgi:putative phage-type endonuclease
MKAQEILVEQGSPAWLSLRKEKIGSSDSSSIMGVNKWKSEYELWCEKLDLIPAQQENEAMRRGKELESVARDQFESAFGVKFAPKVFVKDFQIASLDGVSECNQVAIEIKCPMNPDTEYAVKGKVPPYYYPQLQHQMIVLDIKEMFYISYHPDSFVNFIVKRDDDYCEKLLDKEKEFWKYLQTLESPPLSDRDYIERSDPEWFEKAQEWHRINRQLKVLEKAEDKLRQDLIELAGGKNCKGAGIKISSSVRRGNIDYSKIPDIANIDLDKYRKPKTVVWRLGEI